MKRFLIIFILLQILFQPIAFASSMVDDPVRAKVLSTQLTQDGEIIYTATVLEGIYEGSEFTTTYAPIKNTRYDFHIKEGSIILVTITENQGLFDISLKGMSRNYHLNILTIIFVGLLLLFGRKIGMASLLSLVISGLCIYYIYIPLILQGVDIIFITILCCILIVSISFIIIAGFTKKSFAAIVGTLGGIVSAFILIKIFSELMCITGTLDEHVYLLICDYGLELDFSKLFISGVMIGTIGVLMDVSMSVSSVVFELKSNSPQMTFSPLIRSGLNVGKDVMSTMINTLILAYAGTALPLCFWLFSADFSFASALNTEEVASEILRALCGSIGLILAVPMTSITAAYTSCKKR